MRCDATRLILPLMIGATTDQLRGETAECLADQRGMQSVLDSVRRVLDRPVDVLLQGESGTGKELVARILHEADSRRCRGRFVAVNCAALPEGVLEAEIFGVRRGAYTSADADRPGLLAQADGGTLFLDEVGDLPVGLQPKLLRVLQERRVRPLGGVQEQPVDVRIVSATHLDLRQALEEGRFRADLYFRLADYIIDLPPLRRRRQDILPLARRFLAIHRERLARPHLGGFTPRASSWLRRQDWSQNNVRELEVILKRTILQCDTEQIDLSDLIMARDGTRVPSEPPIGERERLEAVLQRCSGNIAAAARELGLKRSTLFDRLRRFNIQPARFSGTKPS